MTGADLLSSISAADQRYAYESEQFSVIAAAIKAKRRKNLQRFAAIGIAAVLCIAVFGAVRFIPQFFKILSPSETPTIRTPAVIPPVSAPPQPVPTTGAGTTRAGQNDGPALGGPAAVVPSAGDETAQEETTRQTDAPVRGAAQGDGTGPAATIPGTTDGREEEPAAAADPPAAPESEAALYGLYTYVIADSAFSSYRLGKAVGAETVGERLEDAAATGIYVRSDGTIQEDETLRCEIFSLAGVDPEIAVCVRFIDRGKGLKTDRCYLLYHPDADTSAIEAYLR